MNKNYPFGMTFLGVILIFIGSHVARTGVFAYGIGGNHFPVFPWVGWFFFVLGSVLFVWNLGEVCRSWNIRRLAMRQTLLQACLACWKKGTVSKHALSNIGLGFLAIITGQRTSSTGMITENAIFPAFRWASWVMALSGVVFLAYGIYGLLGRNRKDHNAKNDPDQNDESV